MHYTELANNMTYLMLPTVWLSCISGRPMPVTMAKWSADDSTGKASKNSSAQTAHKKREILLEYTWFQVKTKQKESKQRKSIFPVLQITFTRTNPSPDYCLFKSESAR